MTKKICCASCGRQIIEGPTNLKDKYVTTSIGMKPNIGNTAFCGHCVGELDHLGLFPEEHRFLTKEEEEQYLKESKYYQFRR